MEYFEITGGTPLHGSITLQGSKNAALPLMAASILHPGRTTLHHVPAIRDVDVMIEITGEYRLYGTERQRDADHRCCKSRTF